MFCLRLGRAGWLLLLAGALACETRTEPGTCPSGSEGCAPQPPSSCGDLAAICATPEPSSQPSPQPSVSPSPSPSASPEPEDPCCVLPWKHSPGLEIISDFLDEGDKASADLILDDVWPVPRYEPVRLRPVLRWTEDPYRQDYWVFIFYSLRPTSHLLWAFQNTRDTRYRDKLIDVFEQFSRVGQAAPMSQDKHATAYRAMVFVNSYWKLKHAGAISSAEEQLLIGLIRASARFLEDPENFDADYNHGFAQAAALLLVAENFPAWPEASQWRTLARQRVQTLMELAIDEDGVANEKSPYYHFYILNHLWELREWSQGHALEEIPGLDRSVRQMIRYGTAILSPDGSVPMLGVSQGRNLRNADEDLVRNLRKMGAFDPRFAYSLWGGTEGVLPEERSVLFPSSGHAVLRSNFGSAETFESQTHVVVNVGPYRTTHSHLDALGINLYAAGRTVLTDSGYYTDAPGRAYDYFHSTAAHNTVVVDDSNQLDGVCHPGLFASGDTWSYQSGWHQLYAGVTHGRSVLLLEKDLVLVLDRLRSDTPRRFDQTWHLDPALEAKIAGTGMRGVDSEGLAQLQISQAAGAGLRVMYRRGQMSPTWDGWVSARENERVAADVVRFRQEGQEASFVTLIATGAFASSTGAAVAAGDGRVVHVCTVGTHYLVTVEQPDSARESVKVERVQASCPVEVSPGLGQSTGVMPRPSQ